MKMKRIDVCALLIAQMTHQREYLTRTIIANTFHDDDIDYATSCCDTMSSIVATLTCDDYMNAHDDELIDVRDMMYEIALHACDGVCNAIHENEHFMFASNDIDNLSNDAINDIIMKRHRNANDI